MRYTHWCWISRWKIQNYEQKGDSYYYLLYCRCTRVKIDNSWHHAAFRVGYSHIGWRIPVLPLLHYRRKHIAYSFKQKFCKRFLYIEKDLNSTRKSNLWCKWFTYTYFCHSQHGCQLPIQCLQSGCMDGRSI